uniref:BPTI/Kunitz inhibitor domain-containing protein n=2 Tax=Caenorhabditis japonica TaxID=281687 RepID=A0A8R1I8T7_CAEJA
MLMLRSFAHSIRRDAPFIRSVSAHHLDFHESRVDCYSVVDPGSCGDYRLMWHYSAQSNACRQFYYGGCAGNTNRFETREQCEESCVANDNLNVKVKVESVSEASKSLADVKLIDPVLDSDFGGYPSQKEEEEEETYVVVDTQALPELCMLPEQRGSCYGNILRWR